MEIETKAYGKVEINPEEILTFGNGLPGFEDMRKFVLVGDTGDQTLCWLQSLEEPGLAFVVIRPEVFKPGYCPSVHSADLADLELDEVSDAVIFAIAVVPEDVKKMTANLRAPLVINRKNKLAKQIVLSDDQYKIKEPVFTEK